ncbi:hypothetical protein MKS88_004525 [Plasmodium brasilianum]|uniref:RAP protein n=2 Tax=Plasmodium (Plasmodium) TaxID=418103 RepID=A0A1A8W719_PLAMA|nr:conserved Plasmodium protein, unknown function [Plasmodium malariae]KAI4836722.1 hypothetical protein MKS88_004525 [Plasmodium brasilianum]SBS88603.1 conserved Plasmodium protein, unknown function [Plasmodium malariae]SCO94010.1 conserved Plasmodium protein, unknown function [Plasmodium malariae]
MFKNLLFQLIEYRKNKLFVLFRHKWIFFFSTKNKNDVISRARSPKQRNRETTKRVCINILERLPGYNHPCVMVRADKKYKIANVTSRLISSSRSFVTAQYQHIEYNKKFTFQNEDNVEGKKGLHSYETTERSSLEKILDETNSMIYINEICLQMDKKILKCQTYEDVLSILITHRGALFLQNLITAIRMLAGLVVEEKKGRIEHDELSKSTINNKYTYFVKPEEEEHTVDDNVNRKINPEISSSNSSGSLTHSNKSNLYKEMNESGMDKIENNLIKRYEHIFDILNNKQLLENENKFQQNKKMEEIIVLDERFAVLIDDIYKNRKHFDVVSICHILISLKELNYKHFLLFNSFVNPLKKFDIYIKEQFKSCHKISYITSVIQLLLQCFNTYIWAGYYSLDIYNKLINSILLNNFIPMNERSIYEQHQEQLSSYTYMNYKYDMNYPICIEDILAFFNINRNLHSLEFISTSRYLSTPMKRMILHGKGINYDGSKDCDNNDRYNNKDNSQWVKYCNKKMLDEKCSQQKNSQVRQEDVEVELEVEERSSLSEKSNQMDVKEGRSYPKYFNENTQSVRGKENNMTWYCSPIFLNIELFIKSLEIYKNIYVYNFEFFKTSEKVVYYYTQYLCPSNLSLIADAFSKHRIFALEHDRIFFHISKIVENNFEKFSYEHIYLILRSFKRMNLFFEKCLILSAEKFRPYFHYLYIHRKEAILPLRDISVLLECLSFFNFTHKSINECIIESLNYLEDYIDDIDEETSINISYALVLSNLYHINTYFFSFVWRKIGKTTYWEKRKKQVCMLWLSHMIQFKWMEYDLPKFCVLECVKVFFLNRKENMYSFSKIISSVSKILDELQIDHHVSVDTYNPYILDILIKNKRQVLMLTQDTTRNEINRELGDSKIVLNHLKLYGYNVRSINIKYFDSLTYTDKQQYIKKILMSF